MLLCICCGEEFNQNSPKQIYCSTECRQKASKEKILERYHIEKRKKRKGKEKKCAGGCGITLSIYNDSSMCDNCITHKRRMSGFMKELKNYFDYDKA